MTKPRNPGPRAPRQITPELVRDMLTFMPPDVERETWVRVGMAIKSELPEAQAFELWSEWSSRGATYDERSTRDTWRSLKGGGPITIATLIRLAQDHGYKLPAADAPAAPLTPEQAAAAQAQVEQAAQAERARRAADEARWRQRADKAARDSCELWAEAREEGAAHAPYLVHKGVGAHGVRVLAGGMLLVPLCDEAGQMLGLQRIAGAKRPAGWDSDKRFMPGQRKKGLFHLMGQIEGAVALLLAEGYATSASLHEATGLPVAMCVDAGNMPVVAAARRQRHRGAQRQEPRRACRLRGRAGGQRAGCGGWGGHPPRPARGGDGFQRPGGACWPGCSARAGGTRHGRTNDSQTPA
jgi:putative DNA primase/helicase